MKVLVLCDRNPVSMQDGLVLRLRHFVAALRGRHSFDLLCLDRGAPAGSADAQPLFGQTVRVPWPDAGAPPAGRLRKVFDATTNYPRSLALQGALQRLLAAQRYDLICDAGANLFNAVLPVLRGRAVPLLADQVDDSQIRLRRELAQAGTLRRRASLLLHLNQEARWARTHIARADTVVLATEADAASFRRAAPQARTAVVGNGVDPAYFTPAATPAATPVAEAGQPRQDFDLVFEGAMDFPPNVDTALRLVNEVLPLLQRSHPQARVLLLGRDPVDAVRALAGPAVHVTGTVPDVRPWLARARVFACPMQLGAGIKNKLLQAWAMGLPVVATACAAEGLNARDGVDLLLRETPQAFAQAVAALLDDGPAAHRLGAAGRETVVARHSWDSRALDFERAMQAAVAAGAGRRAR